MLEDFNCRAASCATAESRDDDGKANSVKMLAEEMERLLCCELGLRDIAAGTMARESVAAEKDKGRMLARIKFLKKLTKDIADTFISIMENYGRY